MADESPKRETLHYRRSHFVTRLPVDFFYTPSHCWLERRNEEGLWRVGLTKFATRMLGELVDFGFEEQPGAAVQTGQIIGWVEGFKAISDIYCVINGRFDGTNAALEKKINAIDKYIFVNRQGVKVVEKTRLGLALELRDGTVSIVSDGLLFSRALEAVIGNLRDSQHEQQTASAYQPVEGESPEGSSQTV